MSSRHARVQVSRDPQLERAIRRGRSVLGPAAPTSQVLRELALRGAEAFEADQTASDQARDFLVSVARGESGLDLDGLRSVRERAWR